MTRLTMEKEYRDCPSCGAKDSTTDPEGPMTLAVNNKTKLWSVDCLNCGFEGPTADTAKNAIAKWNEPSN